MSIGVHTIAVLQGIEKYETLKEGYAPVLQEINSLINDNFIEVLGVRYELNFLFGGDYKVMNKDLP